MLCVVIFKYFFKPKLPRIDAMSYTNGMINPVSETNDSEVVGLLFADKSLGNSGVFSKTHVIGQESARVCMYR